jgi:hypothetical protein
MAAGRPKNEDKELGITDQEYSDTMYWCGLISTYSGLNDREIEQKIEYAGLGENEIESRRSIEKNHSHGGPVGRQFNRWRNGKERMDHHQLKNFVNKAIMVKLLPPRRNFSISNLNSRSMENTLPAAIIKENIFLASKAFKTLHDAKQELAKAAQRFEIAAKAAEEHGVDIFDTILPNLNISGDAPLERVDSSTISKRIGEIASWCIYRYQVHQIDEPFSTNKGEPVPCNFEIFSDYRMNLKRSQFGG